MATKKKAAKPAKKATPKKAALPKKVVAKPAGKPAKKAVPPKKAAKPLAKKAAPVKKAPLVKKPAPKPAAKHLVPHPAVKTKHLTPKVEIKKPLAKTPEKKPEVKHVPIIHTPPVRPEPKKVVTPAKPVKVVMPEIKTKTVRKYEPEFTKSVLDTYQQESTGPTMRYSDAELTEFRELITKKLDAAKKELAYLQGLITRKDEMGGDDTDNRYMTMEDGSMSMEREQLSQMASRQITFIDHLEKAMMRIENKTYGICRVTGKLIDKARLRAVPHATLSIEAKQTMNK